MITYVKQEKRESDWALRYLDRGAFIIWTLLQLRETQWNEVIEMETTATEQTPTQGHHKKERILA